MNRKYEHSAYCGYCERWVERKALAFDSSGREMCPYCHGRVRLKRHPHDLPKTSCLMSEKVAEETKAAGI